MPTILTLKVPLTTAVNFGISVGLLAKGGLIFHVNHLDDSHEISSLIWFLKAGTEFEDVVCCNFWW